jgi:acyl-ACP thioesterase
VGYQPLHEQGKLWVLSRLRVEVERYPRWGEKVQVLTWPRAAEKVFALRDFEFLDAQGNRIVAGSSAWLVINADTRRPQRADKLLSSLPTLSERKALTGELEKLSDGELGLASASCSARYSDIDMNGHVNNAHYVNWIMNSYPLEFHRAHLASCLEINFVGETRLGESISVFTLEKTASEFCHTMVKTGGDETVCRAHLQWRTGSSPPL